MAERIHRRRAGGSNFTGTVYESLTVKDEIVNSISSCLGSFELEC